MSDDAEVELKGGHLPAVKVGGMRIARTRQISTGEAKEKPEEMTKEEVEEFGTGSPKNEKEVLVSGVVAKEEKAYPPEAVKHFHEPVQASKDKRPVDHHMHHINQPR